MKKLWILLLIVCALGLLTNTGWAQDSDEQETDNTDYTEAITLVNVWMDAMQKYEDIPGISAIALEDQEVIWKGAFGDANPDENVPMETNTICSVCSISKLFTSISVMNLYEDGLAAG